MLSELHNLLMDSTITTKLKTVLRVVLPILFWLCIWQALAMLVDHKYFLPDVPTTFGALFGLLGAKVFWLSALLTLLRVIAGLVLGTFLGIVLAVLSNHFTPIYDILSPIISVIKSTPVATFIVILWIMMNGDALAIFIAVLMVMPIVWQNVIDAYRSIDKELLELTQVFEFSRIKKFKLLIFPALMKYLAPALITATGLAWKSEIAAEIIAYTRNSIGQQINDAKYYLDTPLVFAWTIIIILFSICLERLAKYLLRRFRA